MGLREDREALAERKAERESLKEAAEKQRREDFDKAIIEHEDMIAAHEAKIDRFYAYKDDVKKTLVKEALLNIYEASFNRLTKRSKAICESLIGQYVNEVGVAQLLKNMKLSESSLLHTIQEAVDEYYEDITADANAEEISTQVIRPEKVEDFWKQIDKSEDMEDITSMIRLRVSDAEEDFINKNKEDKANVNTILKNTAERVANAKASNDNEYADAVEESESRLAKDAIYKVQHESHRSIFDRMVRNLSEAAIAHEELKNEYIQENGRLNMENIVESARCMYTLLEMVSAIGLEKVDQAYIEDTLKSIK